MGYNDSYRERVGGESFCGVSVRMRDAPLMLLLLKLLVQLALLLSTTFELALKRKLVLAEPLRVQHPLPIPLMLAMLHDGTSLHSQLLPLVLHTELQQCRLGLLVVRRDVPHLVALAWTAHGQRERGRTLGLTTSTQKET